jgi:hypothetical protein
MYMNLSSSMLAATALIVVGGYQFKPIKTTWLRVAAARSKASRAVA